MSLCVRNELRCVDSGFGSTAKGVEGGEEDCFALGVVVALELVQLGGESERTRMVSQSESGVESLKLGLARSRAIRGSSCGSGSNGS